MGFVIDLAKSCLVPSRCLQFLWIFRRCHALPKEDLKIPGNESRLSEESKTAQGSDVVELQSIVVPFSPWTTAGTQSEFA